MAFYGCRLKCKYCINPECFNKQFDYRTYTPEELLDEVKSDDVYFRATGRGIAFGGGEPGLHAEFIHRFSRICPLEWKLCIETS